MKNLILVLLSFLLVNNASADELLGRDKPQHFIVSAGLGALGTHILPSNVTGYERIVYGSLIGFVPGLAKELIDGATPGKKFSSKDLVWDALGSITGSLLYDASVRIYYRPKTLSEGHVVFITYNGTF